MRAPPTFWTAFYAGLGAPALLHAVPPPYHAYATIPSPAQSFASTGALLSEATRAVIDDRRHKHAA